METAKTLARYLGGRLRACRETRRLRQDEVATCARRWGLDWTQATVATIEAGSRQLSAEELLLLPWIAAHQDPESIARGTDAPIELTQILSGGPDHLVVLTPTVTAHVGVIRAVFGGQARDSDRVDGFSLGGGRLRVSEAVQAWWPRMPHVLVLAAHADQRADAERKAARRLRTNPLAVAVLARKRWGRSLTEERERRVADRTAAGAGSEALRARRGHVTRELIEELRSDGLEGWKPRGTKTGGRR
jgi:hypothetical protein